MGLARLLTIPAVMLLVKRPQDYFLAAGIQASVELAAFAMVVPYIFRIAWYRPSLLEIADRYKQAWPLFLLGSALFLTTYSNTVILGAVSSATEVGYFSAADKLIKASIAGLNPLSQAYYPHIVAARQTSFSSALKIIRQSCVVMSALSILASAAVFFFAEPVCRVLLGNSFHQAARVLQCLAPLPLLSGILNVFGAQTMLVFGMDKTLMKIMFASALVGLPATLMLSYRFGALGSAVGSVITALFIGVGVLLCLHHKGLRVWNRTLPEAVGIV